jgi:hypothetical protein
VIPVMEGVAGALPTDPLMVVCESALVTPVEARTPKEPAVCKSGVAA